MLGGVGLCGLTERLEGKPTDASVKTGKKRKGNLKHKIRQKTFLASELSASPAILSTKMGLPWIISIISSWGRRGPLGGIGLGIQGNSAPEQRKPTMSTSAGVTQFG